ncbi:MAG: phage tail tape measure protein, partial [Marivivens sp.]|nr:phage tail tape measure protein [Marivivens sp.]
MDFGEAMKKSAGEVINLADAKDEVGRSASSAFLVLKEGMGDVDGLTTALQNSDGAAADMAATMDDTAEGAMKRMQSAIEGAQIEIGQALAPIMIKLAGIVSDLAARFSSMSDGGQLVIMAISGIAALIGPLLLVIPTLI